MVGSVHVPVKRNPIMKDYCNCWGIQVIYCNGLPHALDCNNSDIEVLETFLTHTNFCVPLHITNTSKNFIEVINLCKEYNIPIVAKFSSDVTNMQHLELLVDVPHNTLILDMDFTKHQDSKNNYVFTQFATLMNQIRLLSWAKSHRCLTMLNIKYTPLIGNKFNMYEVIEFMRNYINHAVLEFTEVDDDTSIKDILNFKSIYTPNIPSRTWVIKESHKKDLYLDLYNLMGQRRIGIEFMEDFNIGKGRIKKLPYGLCESYHMGMKSFLYTKNKDGTFVTSEHNLDCYCPICNKELL